MEVYAIHYQVDFDIDVKNALSMSRLLFTFFRY